jgi:branched-chain amino acid transport system ATP-binding protein
MLTLDRLEAAYGESRVLHGINLEVGEREIGCIIGRNGMGKTTTLRAIMGLVQVVGGRVRFDGTDLSAIPPHRIPRHGIGFVPQGRHIFPEFTVRENLTIGVLRGRPDRARLEWIFDLFPRLKERLNQLGGSLSGGEQQMLAIGRALLPGPKLLLLDEPTEGLSPLLAAAVREAVRRINASGMAVLLVEQNPREALAIAHTISVVEKGTIRLHRRTAELDGDAGALEDFLGVAPT